ncbi:MAG: hypothetical protein AUJ85_10235 [Elusimicrobia bacterium CG1_02_37_114]|nr:MAG: hypothetical protein AUJ85_10235 [Elusimicrobia bacterium CG1_02_37_114]PIZ13161.1 MAG: hypothetical protein COY53_06260 [Elusimicrobia bacterium CG_4_10_14_0_8_um_filter_37_32]
MLSENTIKELSVKLQTTEINIAREYFQHLFLSNLYKSKDSEKLAFKGGTALRIIYGSPRFSEDIDFTGNIKIFHIKSILNKTIEKIRLEGVNVTVLESKETTGGFLAIYETKIHSSNIRVELNVSLRQKQNGSMSESHLIVSMLHPAYTVIALNEKVLVKEKIEALLSRKVPRDIFDMYFILRNRMSINVVVNYQSKLLKTISGIDKNILSKELKIYLPKSHWNLLNNFPEKLINDLKRI